MNAVIAALLLLPSFGTKRVLLFLASVQIALAVG